MALPGVSLVRLRALCSVVTGAVKGAQTPRGTGFLWYGTKARSSQRLGEASLSRNRGERTPQTEDRGPSPLGSSRNPNLDLLQEFPDPKNLLNSTLARSLGVSDLSQYLQYNCTEQTGTKRATVTLLWPCRIEEEGFASRKIDAERFAAAAACLKLRDMGVIGPNNQLTLRGGAYDGGGGDDDVMKDLHSASEALSTFPQPKSLLNRVLQLATSSNRVEELLQFRTTGTGRGGKMKRCTLTLLWPQEATFTASASNRSTAERKAAALACVRLKELQLLDKNNNPLAHVQYHREQVKEAEQRERRPLFIHVPKHLQANMREYLAQFPVEAEVQKVWEEEEARGRQEADPEEEEECVSDAITGRKYRSLSEDQALHLSARLQDQWERADPGLPVELPVDAHRQRLAEAVASSRVVVVAGETGCGKTTRIPRFLLEEHVRGGAGAHCNILVTQPRRISAVSVAHRVVEELGPSLKHCVGYQVRLESRPPAHSGGSMLFLTVGVLLKKLQSNPHLEGISHVVVDEVHERDINTDLLLALLRSILKENPHLKVVLMSATGDNQRLSHYFGDCPIITVPGFMHPVQERYLEEVLRNMGQRSSVRDSEKKKKVCSDEPSTDLDLVTDVIEHIDKNGEPGAMLCFLPGWQDIRSVQEKLESRTRFNSGSHMILPLHSSLSVADQQLVFQRPPQGWRKIVLATNIAETSITIDDIVHVVDAGTHKEHSYDPHTKVSCLDTVWISRSNITQRKGRAGRCQPGYSYHLFTSKQMDALMPFPVPEILRTPLESLIMQAKIHSPNSKAVDFLSQVLDCPLKEAVMDGVQSLQDIGVLDKEEGLTPLGRRVACMSCDPRLGKVMVLSSVFGCVLPLLSVAACLTRDPFFNSLQNRALVKKTKESISGSGYSDYLVFSRIVEFWRRVQYEGDRYERENFLEENTLSRSSLRFINGLISQFSENLCEAELVSRASDCQSSSSVYNTHSDQDELLKAVLLAGLYPNLIQMKKGSVSKGRFRPKGVSFRTSSGQVLLHRSSVNKGQEKFASRWLTFFSAVKSNGNVFIRDSSVVHPLALLLMTDCDLTETVTGDMVEVSFPGSSLVRCQLSAECWEFLWEIRTSVHTMLHRTLSNPANAHAASSQNQRLLSLLVEMLNGTQVDVRGRDQMD